MLERLLDARAAPDDAHVGVVFEIGEGLMHDGAREIQLTAACGGLFDHYQYRGRAEAGQFRQSARIPIPFAAVRHMSSSSPIRLQTGDALIAVDVQNDFLPGGSLAVPQGDAVVPALNRYLAAFAARALPVFATRDWHPPNHCSFRAQGGIWPPHCVAATRGAEFAPGLALPPDGGHHLQGGDARGRCLFRLRRHRSRRAPARRPARRACSSADSPPIIAC